MGVLWLMLVLEGNIIQQEMKVVVNNNIHASV
jgi:hypothetical protein